MSQDFNVLVDYAHTHDALKNACSILQEITSGKLIAVFGCGGDRDRSKRALMLHAVSNNASVVIVTSDNPRSEPIEQIFEDMRADCTEDLLQKVQFIEDRRRAISIALDAAVAGDTVLIAGKGHEVFQEFDGRVVPFDDRRVARELMHLKGFDVLSS